MVLALPDGHCVARQRSGQNNSSQGSYHAARSMGQENNTALNNGALQQRLRTIPNVQRLFDETGVREADPLKDWTEHPNEQYGGPDKELIRKTDGTEVKVSV